MAGDVTTTPIMVSTDMEAQGGILLGKAEDIDQMLAELLTRLRAIEDFWESPASREFVPFFNNWNSAASEMFGPGGVLGQVANVLNVAWNNYTECEFSNVKTWQTA